MRWWCVAWMLLAACGRVDFDAPIDGGGDGGGGPFTFDLAAGALPPRVQIQRASVATYVGADRLVHTAAPDQPRFDHDPVTGDALGLEIESAGENFAFYSESLDQGTEWFSNGAASVNADATTAPDGSQAADEVVDSDTTGDSRRAQSFAVTTNDALAYTFSIFLKAGTQSLCSFAGEVIGGTLMVQTGMELDLANGVIVDPPPLTLGYGILPYANGWYRVWLTIQNNGSNNDQGVLSVWSYLNDQTLTGSVFAWGAQIEQAQTVTSYVPSLAGTSTSRAADDVRIDDLAWFNPDGGTLQVTAAIGHTRSDTQPAACLLGAGSTCIARDGSTGNAMFAVNNVMSLSGDTWTVFGPRPLELTWNASTTSFRDGAVSSVAARLPGAPFSTLALGFDGTRYLDGWVSGIAVSSE